MDRTYKTFCETAVDTLKSPLKRLKSFSRQEEVFWALKDINFEVFPGEVVGIIGRNGAGKSTLLKILSRITHPTEGEIILRGRVASLLEVGTGFHPELTGRENVYFNGAILGMTKQEIEDKFDEIVAFSGVADFLDTPLKRYSSGMQVRLAFAVAAHLEPEILVVDEVLAVGDAEFQKKCLGKMKDVATGGRTVLFVSHNMAAVRKLCDKSILLTDGKIQNEGITKDIIDEYLSNVNTLVMNTPLAQRRDRKGDGTLRFIDVTFENFNGEKLEYLSAGEDVRIILDYIYKGNEILKNELVALDIVDNGEILIHFDTSFIEQNFKEIPLKGRIICNIPKLPLLPGTYSITLFCSSPDFTGIDDWIEDAIFFNVKSGSFFKSGLVPGKGDARILVDHFWRLEKLPP
jgi:lipopolysaccharide transport system ATP-binding protein